MTSKGEQDRLDRLERQMRENLRKRKALAKQRARADVAEAEHLLAGDGRGGDGLGGDGPGGDGPG